MTVQIWEFNSSWYRFSSVSFALRPRSIVSSLPWIGATKPLAPHAQPWFTDLTMSAMKGVDADVINAFFSRVDGMSGCIRIGDGTRLQPKYNRTRVATQESWSDGSYFDDGTGWASGLLPPTCFVGTAALARTDFVVLAGLPATIAGAISRDDRIEIRPNGEPAEYPHYYAAMHDGSTDSSGFVGFEIRPRLRRAIAVGDQVVLYRPTSVFRAIDSDQGMAEAGLADIVARRFSLIEALDLV